GCRRMLNSGDGDVYRADQYVIPHYPFQHVRSANRDRKPLQILAALLERPGELVTREEFGQEGIEPSIRGNRLTYVRQTGFSAAHSLQHTQWNAALATRWATDRLRFSFYGKRRHLRHGC